MDYVLVGVGGSAGAMLRLAVANGFARRFGTRFPYGTLFINVTGSFILALFLTLAARQVLADSFYRWLVSVGFLWWLHYFFLPIPTRL